MTEEQRDAARAVLLLKGLQPVHVFPPRVGDCVLCGMSWPDYRAMELDGTGRCHDNFVLTSWPTNEQRRFMTGSCTWCDGLDHPDGVTRP